MHLFLNHSLEKFLDNVRGMGIDMPVEKLVRLAWLDGAASVVKEIRDSVSRETWDLLGACAVCGDPVYRSQEHVRSIKLDCPIHVECIPQEIRENPRAVTHWLSTGEIVRSL